MARRSNPRPPKNSPARHHTTFRDIDFGEDDANIEWELSTHNSKIPVFIKAYYEHPLINFDDLINGRRYFVLGQKGTGKTAILRRAQRLFDERGEVTHFMIFRDEVASKEELDRLGTVFAVNVNDVKKTHHHLYTLERLLLLIFASKLSDAANIARAEEENESQGGENSTSIFSPSAILKRVFGKPLKQVVDVTLETIEQIADVVRVDPSKLSKGVVTVDPSILLRRANQKLFAACVRALEGARKPVKIFIDEIHFTYRIGQDHDQDAALVRDLIRSVNKINREFREARAPAIVYAALRSEFIQHPLISAAELHPHLTAYGMEISWATFNANFNHPMFEIGARRVDAAAGLNLTGKQFMKACFANFTDEDAEDFVQSTWSKPRDMIRFLRTCREMFPDKATLSQAEYKQVFHRSCVSARKEIETALTSFLTMKGVERVFNVLSQESSNSLERGFIEPVERFLKRLQPIVKSETQVGAISESQSLFILLYMLGAVYTARPVQNQIRPIIHSFHRGQENPDYTANVGIHRAIAKSYS